MYHLTIFDGDQLVGSAVASKAESILNFGQAYLRSYPNSRLQVDVSTEQEGVSLTWKEFLFVHQTQTPTG